MLRFARRWFRRFFPRRLDPWLDAPIQPTPLDPLYHEAYLSSLNAAERSDAFAAARYDDARRWRGVLDRAGVSDGLVLDLASGSGGGALALAAGGRRIVTIDCLWNETARSAYRRCGASYRHVIGDAAALPFRDASFAAVACLDSFEHFARPGAAAAEASRVVRSGGRIFIETPARLAWLFRRDPHFGIRFLLLLPSAAQRRVAAWRGFDQPHHYVDRIYTSAARLEQLFPACRIERTLTRSRLPRRWFWDALILRKAE
jgi:SAM-dependent methyltransferase